MCGADLDTKRWDAGPGVGNRVGSWFSSLGAGPSLPSGMGWVVVLFLFLFGGSILAFLLGLF